MPTLNWIGKDKVVSHHLEVPYRVLEHKYGFRSDDENDKSETHSGNKIIHGDNLEALKALLPEYERRINCVYIDPPYNTGKEDWRYNDNVNDPHIKKWLGEVVGKEGEDLTRHDKWACMMYPRLRLLEKLMSDDASLVISIGYHELHSLIFLCRAIFPTKQIIPVTVQTSGGKPSGGFNYLHEYLVFVVSKDFEPNLLDFCGGTPRRPFEGLTLSTFNKVNRPNQTYPIFINPETETIVGVGKSLQELIDEGSYTGAKEDYVYDFSIAPEGTVAVWPISSKGKECVWRQIPSRVKNDWEKGYIKVTKNNTKDHPNLYSVQYLPEGLIKKIENGILEVIGHEEGKPTLILGENETEGSSVPTIWVEKDFYTVKGTTALKNVLPESEKKFDYPKSPELIAAVIQAISKEDDIILDSFAGSGTTAHALLNLNNIDGGERKFILIEMMDYADDITAERIKRIMKGYPFHGEVREEIYSKKLTVKNILKAETILEEANNIAIERASDFTKISKPKIQDDCIKVFGIKEYDEVMEGLGGEFDFYELGTPIFDEEGNISSLIDDNKIREYVFYTETRCHLTREHSDTSKYLLDTVDGVGYYFFYEKNGYTTLSKSTLGKVVTEKAEQYIIYANCCTLSKETLAKYNIVFKKISSEIKKF
jgi:adenine-specific DNA-methyltransferase